MRLYGGNSLSARFVIKENVTQKKWVLKSFTHYIFFENILG